MTVQTYVISLKLCLFAGGWHPATVRAVGVEAGMIEVLWDEEYSTSILPEHHVKRRVVGTHTCQPAGRLGEAFGRQSLSQQSEAAACTSLIG